MVYGLVFERFSISKLIAKLRKDKPTSKDPQELDVLFKYEKLIFSKWLTKAVKYGGIIFILVSIVWTGISIWRVSKLTSNGDIDSLARKELEGE